MSWKHKAVRWLLQPSLLQRLVFQFPLLAGERLRRYPAASAELANSAIMKQWWYYSIEMLPGQMSDGIYPSELPFLPRILLANAGLEDQDCLDLGSMEGLLPVLMCRRGARRVLATDAVFHCYRKLLAVQHYHKVRFGFQQVGSMYQLADKLGRAGTRTFDLINVSGLLYHVFSPMLVIGGVRPLLKTNGLMIVSTNVVETPGYGMEFNEGGRFQPEANTFWYLSVPMIDYLLRYFCLQPIDCLYLRRPAGEHGNIRNGYLSVVCRATDDLALPVDDGWAVASRDKAWEYLDAVDRSPWRSRRASEIVYRHSHADAQPSIQVQDIYLDRQLLSTGNAQQSHHLKLDDDA